LWWEITGIDAMLSARLWDAMTRSSSPIAKKLRWFFTKLEHKPVRDIEAAMEDLHRQVSVHLWVTLLEHCVVEGTLSRHDANEIGDTLLRWTTSTGAWFLR
jgi:hypothetical protein